MALLSFEHVVKSYRDGRQITPVLRDASFEVYAGDVIGLWGMRRSGKTTVLRLAAGLEVADLGRVRFDGIDLGAVSGDRRASLLRGGGIGLVSMDRRPTLNQSALEHVALPLLASGMSLREARKPARAALDRTGAARHAETSVLGLSRDALVRVMIAQALVHRPRLLLVDEPGAFLNMKEAREILLVLQQVGSEKDLAMVTASEDIRPLRGASRMMSVGGGVVNSVDSAGEILMFPSPEPIGGGGL